ncbi:DUF547 domain-containing protein [Aquimarina sp. RZ0]|uniref:DUF547 domain-containing protein n=1 Tax=Aquimarina sp. RZ0 TaxID=2607730 RepID=UPI0011F3E5E3|nr:DUF547 domain-containing protein [Aquimarina sp. RZ0]KAA1247605.1 DUF547 domain-containing protein [Aquimarina sp. RZ0]
MKKLYICFGLIVVSSFFSISTAQNRIDHMPWDQLLLLNVSTDGEVNYKGFIRDKFLFNEYFNSLATNHPYINTPENEKLAYWVNLYNAIVMKMVIDNYPVTSINDIKNPWKQKQIVINDTSYSLDDIEHNILRKMNEPRIHFLLSCAAKSSPKLWNRAYTARNVQQALQEKTVEYINNRNYNRITAQDAKISKVFEWYKNDFNEGDVIKFINTYATTKIDPRSTISYLEYDWSLNEKKYVNDVTVTK